MNHMLNIRAVSKYRRNPETKEEKELVELDFGDTSYKICKEYLDMYEGIQSDIVILMRFDENSDLCTTYLDGSDRTRREN